MLSYACIKISGNLAHAPSLGWAGRVKTRQERRARSVPVATVKSIILVYLVLEIGFVGLYKVWTFLLVNYSGFIFGPDVMWYFGYLQRH